MEGSIVNQVEITGFENQKESEKFRKKLKSLKSVFNLTKADKSLTFIAEEASWKEKEDHSLVYLFLTDDSSPQKEILTLAEIYNNLRIQHLIISPSGEGEMIHFVYSCGEIIEETHHKGALAHMLGDLIQGGFQ